MPLVIDKVRQLERLLCLCPILFLYLSHLMRQAIHSLGFELVPVSLVLLYSSRKTRIFEPGLLLLPLHRSDPLGSYLWNCINSNRGLSVWLGTNLERQLFKRWKLGKEVGQSPNRVVYDIPKLPVDESFTYLLHYSPILLTHQLVRILKLILLNESPSLSHVRRHRLDVVSLSLDLQVLLVGQVVSNVH